MGKSAPFRLLIVDDHEVVRIGLAAVLDLTPGISVVGQASTVQEALSLCRRTMPDVVLLDIHLPDGSGVDAARRIVADCPNTHVLFLTSFADDHTVREAALSGAHGYMLKNIASDALIRAIRTVASGKPLADPELARYTPTRFSADRGAGGRRKHSSLSPQEQRLLPLVASGMTNKEIAAQLQLSEKTVKNYLASICLKLQLGRRSQIAALYAGSFKGVQDLPPHLPPSPSS